MRTCEKPVGVCYTGQYQRPRRDQREKVLLIHYDVVSSSHTLNLVKLHQTAHRHRIQHPERSIRFRFRSDPDRLLDALFSFLEGCGTLQAGVAWSKFQTRHHFITRVESESGSSGGGGM